MLSSDTPYDVTIQKGGHVDINLKKDGLERHATHEGINTTIWNLSSETKQHIENKVKSDFKNSKPSRRFLRQLQQKDPITVTTTLISLFVVWFLFELLIVPFGLGVSIQSPLWKAIFVLSSENILYLWTWITSILSHAGLIHLVVNSVVLASFGYYVEEALTSKKFAVLFFLGGTLSGVSQAVISMLFGGEVMHIVGASGAIAAIIGCAAIIFPNIRIALFFIIPMRIQTGVRLFLFGSIATVLWFGVGAGNIAHIAHITGLLIGLGFGWYHKNNNSVTTSMLQME